MRADCIQKQRDLLYLNSHAVSGEQVRQCWIKLLYDYKKFLLMQINSPINLLTLKYPENSGSQMGVSTLFRVAKFKLGSPNFAKRGKMLFL